VLAALFFLLCIGVFNWWSDPFAIWRTPDVERMNRNSQTYFLRMSKPWQVSRIKPTAVIMGSSRSGSLSPQHPVWAGETPYNLSLHGLTVYEMKHFIQHAQAQGTLDKLLIAIEFDTFIVIPASLGLGYADGRMLNSEDGGETWANLAQRIGDYRDTLVTGSVLAYSLQAQFGKSVDGMRADGSWLVSPIADQKGKGTFLDAGRLLVKRSRQFSRDAIDNNLSIFADILAFCHRHNIDTRLYLSPEHMLMTDLRHHIGYGDEYDDFLRQVVAVNEEVAISSNRPPFPLWGFNLMENVVTHPLHPGGASSGDWFRDGFHFYGKLGDLIMEQVWGDGSSSAGKRLDAGNIDTYIANVEAMRAQFARDQREQVLKYRKQVLDLIAD
jgi:hypothetical protein